MKRLLKYLMTVAVALPFLLLSSCRGGGEEVEDNTTPHTIIFYFTGTKLTMPFYNNISAIEEAMRSDVKKKNRIICFFQGGDRQKSEVIELLYDNGLCKREVLATYEMPHIMSAEKMTFFLSEIIRVAPADSYGLVLGGHGTGWIPIDGTPESASAQISSHKKGVNQAIFHREFWKKADTGVETRFFGEEYNDGGLNGFDIPNLAKALAGTNTYFDYILFDACLMANVEALYDLRRNSRYIIASSCEIMEAGFPYTDIIPLLLKDNGRKHDLDGVCKAYYTYYSNGRGARSGSSSLIDCSQLEALAEAMKRVNNSTKKEFNLNDIQTFEGYTSNHVFFDLGDYVEQMCDDREALEAFNRQMKLTVPAKYTLSVFWSNLDKAGEYTITKHSGLTTSAPSKLYRGDYANTAWYKATN